MQPIDKPINLPLKDYIIRKTSVKTMINEHTVADIINFQFKDSRQALHYANEVEITGFGKFIFLPRKAERELARMKNLYQVLLGKEKTEKIERQLQSVADEITFLEFKLKSYEIFKSDNRGVEEQSLSSQSIEGEDSDGISSSNGDLQELPA